MSGPRWLDYAGDKELMPVPWLIHRYPDRVALMVTTRCFTYCEHCCRGDVVQGDGPTWADLDKALFYIEKSDVREVLLTGGDPFTSVDNLLRIIARLRLMGVGVIRIGSRAPVVRPDLFDDALCMALHGTWLAVHVNHANELSRPVKRALHRLRQFGVSVLNQSVLLKGINDTPQAQRDLVGALIECGVRPYYLYQCDPQPSLAHLRVHSYTGRLIIRDLHHTVSGYAIPRYIAYTRLGKIPLTNDYIIGQAESHLTLTSPSGEVCVYAEPGFEEETHG